MPVKAVEGNGIRRNVWRAALLPIAVVAFFILGRRLGLGGSMVELRFWIQAHSVLGALVFILLYILAGISAFPALALTLAAGALFGSVKGIVLTSIASALGISAAFLLARTLARDTVARWLGRKKVFRQVERWTGEQGALVVALLRLFPVIPYNILNFAFGLTSLRFRTYLFWSWLSMLPGTIFYVTGMDALTRGMSEGRVPWIPLAVALSVILFLLALLPWARRQFRRRNEGDGGGV